MGRPSNARPLLGHQTASQDARNQARKKRVSLTTEIKMDALLGRSSEGRQALATWAFEVVPSGMPLRDENVT